MPPKRLSENPPPASSSSEEEEEEEEEEGEGEGEGEEEGSDEQNDSVADDQKGGVDKDVEDDDDDEDEEEEEEEEEEEKSPLLKKSTAIATPRKSGSGSDSDSESTQPSPSLSAFNIKFHKPNKSGSKRPAESDSVKETPPPSKRRNKGGGDEETKNKGSAIQRLWSEDDEIAILKGLSHYKSEKGADPSADMVAFHEFIKKSLHVDVSKNQLMDKIRRLKKKYQNNLERAEIGQDPVFSKLHDEKSFELSKKVWEENVKQSKKVSEEKQSGNFSGITLGLASQGKGHELRARKPMRAPNGEVNSVLKREENLQVNSKEEKGEIVEELLWEKYPFFRESLEIEGLSEGVKVTLREQLGMIEKEKLKELEEKCKKLKQAELELFVQRMELVHEQVKLTLDSIK